MTVSSSATALTPAAPARQCGASLIDLGFVALCTVAAQLLCHNAVVTFMIALEAVAVLAIGEGSRGVTVGNMLLGLRTVRADSVRDSAASGILPAGMSRIAVKYFVLIASFLVVIIGYLAVIISPLFSRDSLHQGWANNLANLASVDIRPRAAAMSSAAHDHRARATNAGNRDKQKPYATSPLPVIPAPSAQPSPRSQSVPRTPAAISTTLPAAAQFAVAQSAAPTPHTHAIRPIPVSQRTTATVPAHPRQTPPPAPGRKPTASAVVPPPTPSPRAMLIFDDGSKTALTVPSTLVLGRKPTPRKLQDMVLTVPDHTGTVSRSHARLEITDNGAWITDLGSTNGTRVIGEEGEETPVSTRQRVELHSNSRIALGDMICVIVMTAHRKVHS